MSHKNIKLKPNHRIQLTKATGSLQLKIPKNIRQQYKDFYLSLIVKRGNPDSNYLVNVNDYINNRLYNNSTYRTGVNHQLYRATPDKMEILISP